MAAPVSFSRWFAPLGIPTGTSASQGPRGKLRTLLGEAQQYQIRFRLCGELLWSAFRASFVTYANLQLAVFYLVNGLNRLLFIPPGDGDIQMVRRLRRIDLVIEFLFPVILLILAPDEESIAFECEPHPFGLL